MKITKLRTKVVHFPFDPPIDGGAHLLRSADCVLVFLETDAGLIGEGLVFALNKQRLVVIDEMIRSLEPLVIGLDPELGGSFSGRAFRDIGFLGRTGVAVIGVAGVDNALWDLRGKAAGLNVARLIGACTTAVPAYHSGGLWISRSVDELQREAADFVAQGWRAMKMRISKPRATSSSARVRAVREAIGPDIGLVVDSNQQLTVPRAIRLGRMLEEFNLTWFEEPIPYQDHAGEAEIAAALDTPVASGETEYTSRGMFEMLRARSADILMPDLQRMGDIGEALLGMPSQVAGKIVAGLSQRGFAAGRQNEQFGAVLAESRRLDHRRFLDHDMGIRPTDAEGTDPGAPRGGVSRPIRECGIDVEGRCREIDFRVWPVKMEAGGETAMVERKCRLHEPRDSGSGIQVANIALDRADGAELALR